jgi:trk system potassium uptake protein TrkA
MPPASDREQHDLGRRLARLVSGRMLGYIQLDDGFASAETKPPTQLVRTLGQAQVRTPPLWHHGGVHQARRTGLYLRDRPHQVGPEDILVVAGETRHAEAFAELR